MTGPHLLRLLLGAVLTGGLLAGCGGVDEELTVGSGTADLTGLYTEPAPVLPAALTAPGDALGSDFYLFGGEIRPVSDGRTTVVARSDHLTAYDARTHEERWQREVPQEVCGTSGVVGGRVAVLTGDQAYRGCRDVQLLDVTDGDVLWSRPVRGPRDYVPDPDVALSRTEVHAAGACSEVRRFAVAGGEVLDPLGDPETCSDSAALDDDAVATVRRFDGLADRSELRVTDPATGRSLTSDAPPLVDGEVGAVLSTDPLVLDLRDRGYRALHLYDDRGRPVGFLGRALSPYNAGDEVLPVARSGDVLVLSYEDLPGFRAYDLTTGEELWRVVDSRFLAGADEDGLIWTQPVEVLADDGTLTAEQQVTRTSVTNPSSGELLGALSGPVAVTGTPGDDLLVDTGSGVDVVPLPDAGVGAAPPPGLPSRDTAVLADPGHREGDVLPSQVADACAGVDPDTVAALGLRTDVPAPASCRWDVYGNAIREVRLLEVTARAVVPGELPRGDSLLDLDSETEAEVEEQTSTATGAATYLFSSERTRWPEVDGLGDEARATSRSTPNGLSSTARIRVRSGNVLVTVEATVTEPGPRGPDVEVLEDAVRDAAQDVLDATLG